MTRPAPLAIAAGLALLEGLVLLAYAVLEVAHTASGRVGLAVTTACFFALVGGALVVCAYGLWRIRSWARSPVVVVQLITLLTAWSFRGGDTTVVAVVLAAVSLTVLVCLVHPRSVEALAD
jgi:hypothetical protein